MVAPASIAVADVFPKKRVASGGNPYSPLVIVDWLLLINCQLLPAFHHYTNASVARGKALTWAPISCTGGTVRRNGR